MAPADTALDPATLETLALLKKASLLIFFALFVAVLIRLCVTRRDVHRRHAELPLQDDRVVEPRGASRNRNP